MAEDKSATVKHCCWQQNLTCVQHMQARASLLLCPHRFPDFSLLSPSHDYTSLIDAVFISHFHMDHVGALPYFTEVGLVTVFAMVTPWQHVLLLVPLSQLGEK
jgi:Cft2 family RNA processing exonuclease